MIQAVLRLSAIGLALAATAALIAGCGSSGRGSSARSGATAATAPAQTVGGDVNLRAPDVPGFLPSPPARSVAQAASGPLGPAVERCDGGIVERRGVVRYASPTFERGDASRASAASVLSVIRLETVKSAVYSTGSPAIARRELTAVDSDRARFCLRRLLEVNSRAAIGDVAGPFMRRIKVDALPSPLPGVRVYGVRWSGCFAVFVALCRRERSQHVADYFAFVAGSALVTLHATGIPRAVPWATERRLVALLYSRAQTHAG